MAAKKSRVEELERFHPDAVETPEQADHLTLKCPEAELYPEPPRH
ncbi:hypothetical protein [Pyxidicoccus fallax]|nr:hypothetical protein [Pyxidicoccus fallax]